MSKIQNTFDLTTGVKSKDIAVYNDGRTIIVIYKNTPVVRYEEEGDYIMISVGRVDKETPTMRSVINRALCLLGCGAQLFVKDHETRFGSAVSSRSFRGLTSWNFSDGQDYAR